MNLHVQNTFRKIEQKVFNSRHFQRRKYSTEIQRNDIIKPNANLACDDFNEEYMIRSKTFESYRELQSLDHDQISGQSSSARNANSSQNNLKDSNKAICEESTDYNFYITNPTCSTVTKTSFCIDVLLGKVPTSNEPKSSMLPDEICNKDTQETNMGYTELHKINDMTKHNITKEKKDTQGDLTCCQYPKNMALDNLGHGLIDKNYIEQSHFPRDLVSKGSLVCHNEIVDFNTDLELKKRISTSPDSINSRSLTNSPSVSLAFEDSEEATLKNETKIKSNSTHSWSSSQFFSNPECISFHPENIYYYTSGSSPFHSLDKVQNLQSASNTPCSQPRVHTMQIEWMARAGILYPKLSVDLNGEIHLYVQQL